MKFSLFALILISFLITSCASREARLERTKEIVNSIGESLKSLKGESLYIADEEKRTRFTYYIIDDEIKYINEELFIPTGHFVNFYYFNNNRLIHLDSRSISYIQSENGVDKRAAEKKIFFDGAELLDSDIIIKGQRVELEESEIKELINYANQLMKLSMEHIEKHEH